MYSIVFEIGNGYKLGDAGFEHGTMFFVLQLKNLGRGELLVSLCYQPAASRITVVVLKARNLPKMDITGLSGKPDDILQPNNDFLDVLWTVSLN